ncbi:MAG TPA: cupin domain-containing protein [Methylomirabilota bacterium]|nr:cupin domain-containing protein [Methylomirabilota bacterium]
MCLGLVVVLAVAGAGGLALAPGAGRAEGQVEEKRVLSNEAVEVMEFVFPPGFKGEEHEAPASELGYVLDGELAVVTRGRGKQVVHRGEAVWASRGDVHYSLNESKKPARLLVVLLKER